ncbi:calcium-binding protein [Nannocystis bainbridge]|uniref:Calcium-binding protein n=1 Tax=Nannocystis bainbridge TaxID=2995303 RepID=A0ABT5E675_9BACT|nr:calcium-binding protein [Nannocystis bainbridge]MDC0721358.1 calcium-binding protein [Nannocystis bainbridge]
MTRTVLTVASLLLAPALLACDSKPEPGDDTGNIAASEGTDSDGTDSDGTEGTASPGDPTEGTGTGTEGEGTTTGNVEEAVCTPEIVGDARTCEGGTQFCSTDFAVPDAKYFWGPCLAAPVCQPGEEQGCNTCELRADGVPEWVDTCDEGGTTTPLVLNFGADPVRYASSAADFDLGPACGATDWPTATTPWLAFDRDSSGAIEAGRELFGSATVLRAGGLADNGFTALAELDQDRDGKISASDPAFARLLLWADHDADRRSTAWELTPITSAGIVAIGLTYRNDSRCDGRSNCEIERAAFTYRDALGRESVGEIVDVHLSCQ